MILLTRSVQILVNTNLQTAFNYVSDLTTHPQWSDGELKMEEISSEPIQIGKEYISKGEVGKFQKERPNKLRVTEYKSPHTFGFSSNDPDFGDIVHTFTFVEKEKKVLIIRTMKLSLHPLIAFGFTFFVYPFLGNPSMKRSINNLKTRLEQPK